MILRLLVALIASGTSLLAFDPAGPPPKWTVTEIGHFLATSIVPQIELHEASFSESIEFLMMDRPRDYFPDYKIDEALLATARTVTLKANDVTRLEVFAMLADRFEADILISPGLVTFKARVPSKKQ
jgi:hypothetical protein